MCWSSLCDEIGENLKVGILVVAISSEKCTAVELTDQWHGILICWTIYQKKIGGTGPRVLTLLWPGVGVSGMMHFTWIQGGPRTTIQLGGRMKRTGLQLLLR